jgi:hypothetical protein
MWTIARVLLVLLGLAGSLLCGAGIVGAFRLGGGLSDGVGEVHGAVDDVLRTAEEGVAQARPEVLALRARLAGAVGEAALERAREELADVTAFLERVSPRRGLRRRAGRGRRPVGAGSRHHRRTAASGGGASPGRGEARRARAARRGEDGGRPAARARRDVPRQPGEGPRGPADASGRCPGDRGRGDSLGGAGRRRPDGVDGPRSALPGADRPPPAPPRGVNTSGTFAPRIPARLVGDASRKRPRVHHPGLSAERAAPSSAPPRTTPRCGSARRPPGRSGPGRRARRPPR